MKATVLTLNTPYPLRRYGVSAPKLHQIPRRLKNNTPYPTCRYGVSRHNFTKIRRIRHSNTAYPGLTSLEYGVSDIQIRLRYKEFKELIQPFKDPERVSQLDWKLLKIIETMTELTLEESLSMFMAKIAKRLDENTNLIKELRASTDFAFRNQEASIKALEIQVRQLSIILHEKLSGNLQSSTVVKPRVNDETISTSVETNKPSIRRIDASQYTISNLQSKNLFSESKKMTLASPCHLNDDYWDELKETDGEKDL
ncbi:hypothetical protein Tco_0145985 [Tanacetum coccineum]